MKTEDLIMNTNQKTQQSHSNKLLTNEERAMKMKTNVLTDKKNALIKWEKQNKNIINKEMERLKDIESYIVSRVKRVEHKVHDLEYIRKSEEVKPKKKRTDF